MFQVPDEESLLQVRDRVRAHGIHAELFREPDLGDAATALCTEAVCGDARKVFRRFRLWKEPELCLKK